MDVYTIVALAMIGITVLFIIAALFIRRTIAATIEGFSWERKVLLEHYVWKQKTSYTGYPNGSRNRQRETERYQSYEVVSRTTTTTTVNNVTTTTTQPVYGFVPRARTKYSYEIQEWLESRELLAKGEERAALHWPAYVPDAATQERIKRKQGKYLVFFKSDNGKKYTRKLAVTDWTALDDSATYTLKVDLFGQVRRVVSNTEQVAGLPPQTS